MKEGGKYLVELANGGVIAITDEQSILDASL